MKLDSFFWFFFSSGTAWGFIYQVRTLFLHWLPWMLGMTRPGMKPSAPCRSCTSGGGTGAAGGVGVGSCSGDKAHKSASLPSAANNGNRQRDLELKERSSRSLLANVLDIDDDFRQHSCTVKKRHFPHAPPGPIPS